MLKTLAPPRSSPSSTNDWQMDALLDSLRAWRSRPLAPPVVDPPRISNDDINTAISVIVKQHDAGNLDLFTTGLVLRLLLAARLRGEFLRQIESVGVHDSATTIAAGSKSERYG